MYHATEMILTDNNNHVPRQRDRNKNEFACAERLCDCIVMITLSNPNQKQSWQYGQPNIPMIERCATSSDVGVICRAIKSDGNFIIPWQSQLTAVVTGP